MQDIYFDEVISKFVLTNNIIIIGFMGCGKTTVCRRLEELLQINSVDTDELILAKEKISINEIFNLHGEKYFRDCETNVLIELQKRNPIIISCGGGIVMKAENVEIMKNNGRVVLLTATPSTILNRVKHRKDRPILKDNMNIEFITELMKKREQIYLDSADIIISTDNKSITEICKELILELIKFDS